MSSTASHCWQLAGRTDVRGVYGATGCPTYNSPAPQACLRTLTLPAKAGTYFPCWVDLSNFSEFLAQGNYVQTNWRCWPPAHKLQVGLTPTPKLPSQIEAYSGIGSIMRRFSLGMAVVTNLDILWTRTLVLMNFGCRTACSLILLWLETLLATRR